jgi:hypothetical protein
MNRSVKLPVDARVIDPVFVIVPLNSVDDPLLARNVPVFVRLSSVAVPMLRIVPVPIVVSVPPVTNAPAVNCTCEPSSAMIVPPPLSNIPLPLPVRRRMPPSLARMSPKLTRSPASLGSTTSANPETFASIKPPLRMTIPSSFVPRLPLLFVSPWIV